MISPAEGFPLMNAEFRILLQGVDLINPVNAWYVLLDPACFVEAISSGRRGQYLHISLPLIQRFQVVFRQVEIACTNPQVTLWLSEQLKEHFLILSVVDYIHLQSWKQENSTRFMTCTTCVQIRLFGLVDALLIQEYVLSLELLKLKGLTRLIWVLTERSLCALT